jgi:hypothetical protein
VSTQGINSKAGDATVPKRICSKCAFYRVYKIAVRRLWLNLLYPFLEKLNAESVVACVHPYVIAKVE